MNLGEYARSHGVFGNILFLGSQANKTGFMPSKLNLNNEDGRYCIRKLDGRFLIEDARWATEPGQLFGRDPSQKI